MANVPDRAVVVIAEEISVQVAVSLAVREAIVEAAPSSSLEALCLPAKTKVVMDTAARSLEADSFSVRAAIVSAAPISVQVMLSSDARFDEATADPIMPRSFDTDPGSAETVETALSVGLILPASPARMDAALAVAPRILVLVSLTAVAAVVDIVPAMPRIPKA